MLQCQHRLRACPHQLHYSQVSLLGHDTAAGAKFLWHLEEAIFGGRKEQDVLRQFAQVDHNLRQCLHNGCLNFTSAILYIDDVVLHAREAEQVGGILAIDGDWNAVASSGTKRRLIIENVSCREQLLVIKQRLAKTSSP